MLSSLQMDNPNAIHDTVWSWLSSSIRATVNLASNTFTSVASVFNLLSVMIYYAFYLLRFSLKWCFLLPYYATKSFVGRTFLSIMKRAPDLIIEIFAATLFVGLLGFILFDIPQQAMQVNGNRDRIARAPADPPAPANTNDIGTNTASNNEADSEADSAETFGAVARAGTVVATEANNTEAERLKAAINAALEELICPIIFDLPVDPVITEGGDVVEREAITALIRQRGMRTLRSMRTNQRMGQRIAPCVAIRNVIEKLVESGAVDEKVVTAWRSGREELGRRNNEQRPMRERRGGRDGWLGRAFQQINGEVEEAMRLRALMQAEELEEARRWLVGVQGALRRQMMAEQDQEEENQDENEDDDGDNFRDDEVDEDRDDDFN